MHGVAWPQVLAYELQQPRVRILFTSSTSPCVSDIRAHIERTPFVLTSDGGGGGGTVTSARGVFAFCC